MSARAPQTPVVATYLAELVRWSSHMNLVGSAEQSALEEHVADSLAAGPHLPHGARVVDLGSGAGLPGIPLAIVRRDLEITLVEIREKRVHFLRHVVRSLGLGCEVLRVRIEQPLERGFDYALLRAVAAPERALTLGRPWVLPSGEVWVWAGPSAASVQTGLIREIPLGVRGSILCAAKAHVSRGTP